MQCVLSPPDRGCKYYSHLEPPALVILVLAGLPLPATAQYQQLARRNYTPTQSRVSTMVTEISAVAAASRYTDLPIALHDTAILYRL